VSAYIATAIEIRIEKKQSENKLNMERNIIDYNGEKYEYLGNGCKATGADMGWRMSPDIYFRCIDCGYLMNGDPVKDDICECGKLYKDAISGRFGSRSGDDSIEVYQRV